MATAAPPEPATAGIATRIVRLAPGDLKLLRVNARYMRHEQFQQLVANVRRDGKLTSVPFACRDDDGRYLVLSGNHRVQAAIEAELAAIDVMVTDDPLTPQQRIAIQLSHNAIAGQDDPGLLKQLYDQLTDVDLRTYSGLDDKTLQLMEQVQIGSLSEANLDFMTVTMTFLPEEVDTIAETWAAAKAALTGDEVWLASLAAYERTLDALDLAGRAYGVTNISTSLEIVLRVFARHKEDLAEGFAAPDGTPLHGKWVPYAAIFGSDAVPAEVAALLASIVRAMRDRGLLTGAGSWKALEYMAADFLASGLPVDDPA